MTASGMDLHRLLPRPMQLDLGITKKNGLFVLSYSSAAGRSSAFIWAHVLICSDGAVDHDAHTLVSWSPTLATSVRRRILCATHISNFQGKGKVRPLNRQFHERTILADNPAGVGLSGLHAKDQNGSPQEISIRLVQLQERALLIFTNRDTFARSEVGWCWCCWTLGKTAGRSSIQIRSRRKAYLRWACRLRQGIGSRAKASSYRR